MKINFKGARKSSRPRSKPISVDSLINRLIIAHHKLSTQPTTNQYYYWKGRIDILEELIIAVKGKEFLTKLKNEL